MHGMRWLFQPSSPNSGFTNAQEIVSPTSGFDVPLSVKNVPSRTTYSSSSVDDRWTACGNAAHLRMERMETGTS